VADIFQLYKCMSQPHLPCCSGDAGVGLNVRRLTKQFTSTFTTSYSLRPVADVGSVFRRYPGQWQVFVEDPSMEPGRYLLAAERPTRPAGTACHQLLFCNLACHVFAICAKGHISENVSGMSLGLPKLCLKREDQFVFLCFVVHCMKCCSSYQLGQS